MDHAGRTHRLRDDPTYAATRTWLERLAAASPFVTLEAFGRSGQGRDLLLARVSKGPAENGAAKPVVIVQTGIHVGAIDGRDAGLMLLRDIGARGKEALLDRVNLAFVPIDDVNGHEASSRWNFPALREPRNKGALGDARGINLNRDHAKADAPEPRAMIALIRQLDPNPLRRRPRQRRLRHGLRCNLQLRRMGKYARHRATADWLETRFGLAATAAGGAPADHLFPARSIPARRTGASAVVRQGRATRPLRVICRVSTVLVENHLLKPYRQRVPGTSVLLEAGLRAAGRDAARLAAAKATDRTSLPRRC